MRTTLTLDPDVVRLLDQEMHRVRKPMKQVINEALRRGLTAAARVQQKRYRVRAHVARLQPGLERGRLNALADELEDVEVLRRTRRR